MKSSIPRCLKEVELGGAIFPSLSESIDACSESSESLNNCPTRLWPNRHYKASPCHTAHP